MLFTYFRQTSRRAMLALLLFALIVQSSLARPPLQSIVSGKRYQRLVIRNAMIVDGNGTPA